MSRGFLDEDAEQAPNLDADDIASVEISGRQLGRQGKAMLFDPGDGKSRAIPLSQIRGSVQSRPGYITLRLPQWLAKKEKMI